MRTEYVKQSQQQSPVLITFPLIILPQWVQRHLSSSIGVKSLLSFFLTDFGDWIQDLVHAGHDAILSESQVYTEVHPWPSFSLNEITVVF